MDEEGATVPTLQAEIEKARAVAREAFGYWKLRCWSEKERARQRALEVMHDWLQGIEVPRPR